MQRRLRLPDALLDNHCVQRFGAPFARLGRGDVSALIDELKAWVDVPADLRRAQGQRGLPGFESGGQGT